MQLGVVFSFLLIQTVVFMLLSLSSMHSTVHHLAAFVDAGGSHKCFVHGLHHSTLPTKQVLIHQVPHGSVGMAAMRIVCSL